MKGSGERAFYSIWDSTNERGIEARCFAPDFI